MDEIAATGERVIITKHGKPVSVLSPYPGRSATLFGLHAGTVKVLGDLVEPLGDAWDAES
jgi:antitoxin (DNA-binding transcriptional repressor) of toxin-antitoxin stability system